MGTTRVLCLVLLAVGTATAYPQYGGAVQQQQQEVPAIPVPQQEQVAPLPSGTLTQEQQGALEEFWWQHQGVFNAETPGGTVVVVQEQSPQEETPAADIAEFIPIPSPECASLHGCVPWQNCVEGVFTQKLTTRTAPKAPEEYTQTLCGQIGNICCRIPDDLLALQAVQSQGAGPYGPDGEIIEVVNTGDAIIEVVNTGEGVVVVEEPINTGADPYVDGGEVSTGVVGTVPVVGQNGVAVDGQTVVVVEDQTAGAGPYGSSGSAGGEIIEVISTGVDGTIPVGPGGVQAGGDVPYDESGVINGAVAVPHQAGGTVTVVDQTNIGGVNPGGVATTGGIDSPAVPVETYDLIDTGCTPYTHDCVPHFQCINGEYNVFGEGLLDPRIKPTAECTNAEYPDVPALCCRIPGQAAPPPVETCPGNSICVSEDVCRNGGTANVFTSDIINPILHPTCYLTYASATDFTTGVCCEPPTCSGNQNCVAPGTCAAQSGATYDPALVQQCYQPGASVLGECCDPTPPPLPDCPLTQDCVDASLCDGQGYIVTDGAGLINVRTPHPRCYIDPTTYVAGVCCRPPPPPPVEFCPADQKCISEAECGLAPIDAQGDVTPCVLPGSVGTGLCCTPPLKVLDVCPGTSVCTPEILCNGDILVDADTEQYFPFGTDATWAQCSYSGDLNTKGVCCRTQQQTPSTNPYVAADHCGVRNYELDLRLGHLDKLEKNETGFGEFSWQGIIFFTNYTYKCGASLISDKWLLTGAHCVHGYQHGDFRVRLGEWQVNTYDEPLPYQDVDIAAIYIHPEFNNKNLHNDIALLELTEPVAFKYHINTVCLPNYEQRPAPGTYCVSTGWGKDAFDGNYQHVLKKVDVPAVEHGQCQELLRKTRLGRYFLLDDSFMCAGGEANLDACVGDGGGPLVCQDLDTNRYYVAGITAWGISCGVQDVPGVYADVTVFRPWIDGIINPQVEQQQQQQGPSGYGGK